VQIHCLRANFFVDYNEIRFATKWLLKTKHELIYETLLFYVENEENLKTLVPYFMTQNLIK
jgi:hypothetical protein